MKYILIISSILLLSACASVEPVEDIDDKNIGKTNALANPVPAVPKESIKTKTTPEPKQEVQEKIVDDSFSESKDGFIVQVRNIEQIDEKTVMILMLDNHRYDISQMDVTGLSSLAGVRATDYQIVETAMGGHHVQAKITFPGELFGELIIGLKTDLSFNFDLT